MTHPLRLRPFLPKIASAVQEMLGTALPPALNLKEFIKGASIEISSDELRDRSSPFFLLSLDGEPETVGLLSDGEFVGVIMAAQRTKLEWALGAAVAIAFAREFGGVVEDDGLFYGPDPEIDAEKLLSKLRAQVRPESTVDLRRASEDLVLDQPKGLPEH